jgi:hypothetical protein
MNIHGDEFLRLLHPYRRDRIQKVDELLCLISVCEEEVQTILDFLDVDSILVCAMLEDELFEVEESSLMRDLLSNLNASSPCIRGVRLCAVWTLLVCNHVFHLECLLQYNAFRYRILYRELDFDSSRMRLSPNKACIDDSDFV